MQCYDKVRVWCRDTGSCLHTLTAHTDWVTKVSLHCPEIP